MFIAVILGILAIFVAVKVIRAQEKKEHMKELAFLSVCGDEEAKRELAKANLSPQEHSRLLETAVREKAESGNSEAARYLGNSFENKGDFEQAYKWYRRAAEGGDLPAMRHLAKDTVAGRYGIKTEEERFKWKLYAANHGDGESMFHTAAWLEIGFGVQKSIKEAVMWFERTCACKSSPLWCVNVAHRKLGEIYGEPNSEFFDPPKWKIHYNALVQALRSASKQKDAKEYANAAFNLGCLCVTSLALGTEPAEELKNKKRAAYLLTLAYEAQEFQSLADLALERLKKLDYEIDDATYRIWTEDAKNLNVNMLSL